VELTKAEYERLCVEACENPSSRRGEETSEDAHWRTVCEKVFDYLGKEFDPEKAEGPTRGEAYRQALRRAVEAAQGEYFDALEIPTKHIEEVLSKTGG
jgi:hypothetical protein